MIWRFTALDSFTPSTTGGRRGLLVELWVPVADVERMVFTVPVDVDVVDVAASWTGPLDLFLLDVIIGGRSIRL